MKKYRVMAVAIIMILLTACGMEMEGSNVESGPDVQPQITEVPKSSEIVTEPEKKPENTPAPTEEPAREEPAEPLYVDFTNGAPTGYEIANGWTNGSMFNVTWRSNNVTFENGCMQLIIDKDAMCHQVRDEKNAEYISEPGKSCPTEILEALTAFNAEGRPIWKPMHMQPIYRMNGFVNCEGRYDKNNNGIDVGADIFARGLCLPSDNKMTIEEQEQIIQIVKNCFI